MMKTLGVVFPVHNKLSFTKKAVDSILSQSLPDDIRLFICIIDNASDEGQTPQYLSHLEDEFPYNVIVIRNEENLGFAKACNQGIDAVLKEDTFADILITNNDVEFFEKCFENLIETAHSKDNIGIVGGRLLFPNGTLQHAGAFLGPLGWGEHIAGGAEDTDFVQNFVEEMEYVTGALFYIKNNLLQKLPGFDETFSPAYFEEVDYCYEARKLGFITVYSPNARAIHYENTTGISLYGNSSTLKKELSDKNQVEFYKKHLNDEYVSNASHKLLMSCKIYGNWSFTIVMRNLAKGLKRAGVDVSIAPEEYHSVQGVQDWEIKEMINKPNDYWDRAVLRSCEGDHAYLMPPSNQKRILHTTGESTVVHPGWKDQLNHVDLVLTNSSFFKNVLVESGVKSSIEIIPNSLDLQKYNPSINPLPMQGLRKFNFIAVLNMGDRKGLNILLEAFGQEFEKDEDVTLYVQCVGFENYIKYNLKKDPREWLKEVVGYKSHPSIMINSNHVHDSVFPHIVKNFQCHVFPTRAEGFGNPLVECGALGIPSIVTGYSGVTDFANEENSWLLDYTLVDIPLQYLTYFKNYIGGKWADPSVDHLRILMREAFNHPEAAFSKGKKAAEKAKEYDIEVVGEKLKNIIWEK